MAASVHSLFAAAVASAAEAERAAKFPGCFSAVRKTTVPGRGGVGGDGGSVGGVGESVGGGRGDGEGVGRVASECTNVHITRLFSEHGRPDH